jgi:hypothetical protein
VRKKPVNGLSEQFSSCPPKTLRDGLFPGRMPRGSIDMMHFSAAFGGKLSEAGHASRGCS